MSVLNVSVHSESAVGTIVWFTDPFLFVPSCLSFYLFSTTTIIRSYSLIACVCTHQPHFLSQNALKMRKDDFDHIVDDVSDGEGDEAAGAAARAEMELQEDRARDRAIITAVTEGHDAMRKMQKKGKYTFEKLVGEGRNSRRSDTTGEGAEAAPAQEEEYDEEEMLQRGMKERFEREFQTRARRGRNADSDSDSAEGSDAEENLLDQLGMMINLFLFVCGLPGRHKKNFSDIVG